MRGMLVKDTKENGQNQENGKIADEKIIFPFIENTSIEEDWKQIDEDSEEAYQGF